MVDSPLSLHIFKLKSVNDFVREPYDWFAFIFVEVNRVLSSMLLTTMVP